MSVAMDSHFSNLDKDSQITEWPDATLPRAELTPTRRAIDAFLAVPPVRPDEDPVEAIVALWRPRHPKTVSLLPIEERSEAFPEVEERRKSCCFDVHVGGSKPSWSAHRLCSRCAALNKMLQASRRSSLSALTLSVGDLVRHAECISDTVRKGQTVPLPAELVEYVIDYAMQIMRETKKGQTVAALMHVSSWARLRILDQFAFTEVWDYGNPAMLGESLQLPEDFVDFIYWALVWFLQDPTTRRYNEFPLRPYKRFSEGVFFKNGLPARHATFMLQVRGNRADSKKRSKTWHFSRKQDPAPRDLTAAELSLELHKMLEGARSRRLVPMAWSRALNVHQWALRRGLFDEPEEGLVIKVTILLFPGREANPFRKLHEWKQTFYTKPYSLLEQRKS